MHNVVYNYFLFPLFFVHYYFYACYSSYTFSAIIRIYPAHSNLYSIKSSYFKRMLGAIEIVILEMVLLALSCLLLFRYYKGNMVTADVSLTVYVSWVMGFIGVLLLPYDLSIALINE